MLKGKSSNRKGQGTLVGLVMKEPIATAVGMGIRSSVGLRIGVLAPGLPVGTADVAEQSSSDEREMQTTAGESWGVGDAGPVQSGYESGDTDAMLNAFNRDTHRALADSVGDRNLWPGWFGQGLQAMPPYNPIITGTSSEDKATST